MSERIDPRVAHTRKLVLSATAELLAEEGFGRLTLEGIAERSGVARSTIYRNWSDRSQLLADGFDELCAFPEIPDLGSVEAELRFLAVELVAGLTGSEWAKALPSLIGAAHHDDSLRQAQQRFTLKRRALAGEIFERAAERGELGERDPASLAEMFAAPIFFRFLVSFAPLDDVFVERHIATIVELATG